VGAFYLNLLCLWKGKFDLEFEGQAQVLFKHISKDNLPFEK
jgi:hypothetical protein